MRSRSLDSQRVSFVCLSFNFQFLSETFWNVNAVVGAGHDRNRKWNMW